MAIPLLDYPLTSQNARVSNLAGDLHDNGLATIGYGGAGHDSYNSEVDGVIEQAYRQIFFHAMRSDRDVNLESQLRNGNITVRDFIRGLLLSDTFKRTFYGFNSNYKVVRHLCERILGRKVNGKGEELSWSIVIATKGLEGLVDVLLDSTEYLDAFGYDTVPYQRNRVLPGRELGDTPFNITTPRYDEYYRNILGFPQLVFTGGPAKRLPERAKIKKGGSPQDYMAWVSEIGNPRRVGPSTSADMDYLTKVPYRTIGR